MAHFALLDENNQVIEVHVVANAVLIDDNGHEREELGQQFLIEWSGGQKTRWVQTSYNNKFRKRYAAVGMIYDAQHDAFITERPFASWTFNSHTLDWDPPQPKPTIGVLHEWDEDQQTWITIL